MSRTKNSIRNAFFAVIGSVIIAVMQLINRKVFVNFLASDYLGLNGLFSNILSVLSMSEMGIGTAMIFSLYQPVGEGDIEKTKSLMRLYKRLYSMIGWFVLVVGLLLTPFLSLFIKEMPDIPHIHLYFMMYVLDSGLSYFYTYKRSIIICNQEDYISSMSTMFASIATRVTQLLVLILSHNYFLFLLVQIIFTRLENIVISKIADKKYPYLRDRNVQPLSQEDTSNIKKNIFAMMAQKIGSVIVSGTDNLIISKILGLTILGFYSNYVLLLNTLNSLIVKMFNSITASIGNLIVKQSKDEVESVFKNILFANFWIFSFASTCFCALFQPFIKLWVGEKFLLSNAAVWIFVACFYVNGMRQTVLAFRNATGIFRYDQYRAIVEAVVNLVLSIPLTFWFGVAGVKLGSLLALLMTTFWLEGFVLYRKFFDKSSMKYQFLQLKYSLFTIIQCIAATYVCSMVDNGSIWSFAIECFLCLILSNGIIVLFWHKSPEFTYFLNLIRKMMKK